MAQTITPVIFPNTGNMTKLKAGRVVANLSGGETSLAVNWNDLNLSIGLSTVRNCEINHVVFTGHYSQDTHTAGAWYITKDPTTPPTVTYYFPNDLTELVVWAMGY